MNFEVVQNDITNMLVDAIVLPANEKLREGSGTSRAIFEKAGRKELTRACRELGSCRTGDAVPTLAFNLNARYIIHAVVPKWKDGTHQEYELLSAAYLSALNVADIMKCESIAFPLLAAGNNGFDLGLAYDIAKASIMSFEAINLKRVFLVVYGDNVATFMKGKGASVVNLQAVSQHGKNTDSQNIVFKKLSVEGKQIAAKMFEEQLAKVIEYLKDEKNREKVVDAGKTIAKMVLRLAKKI